MSWLWIAVFVVGLSQDQPPVKDKPPAEPKQSSADRQATPEQLPPEEDAAAKAELYGFNPLKSKKDVTVGDFYLKTRKDAKAAATRYRSATKWNEGNAEAWLKLGEMDERGDVGNRGEAKLAYRKYLELAPDAKNAVEVKRRLAKL